ncbi:helix-turn-helix domain-containing protein [Paenibacillus alvei]
MKENTFTSIEELNAAVRTHRDRHMLSATERAVLDILSQYSCKTIGESFLAKSTIAELIGKSRRTIIRVCNRLESLGIIRQAKRMRKTGDRRQTSNLVVILPVETAYVTPACHSEEAPQLNSKSINNTKERTVKPAWIPQSFFDLVSAHYSDVKTIEEYWRAAYATTYAYNFTAATKAEIAIDAFYAMKGKRKKLHKPIAFFVGVIKRQAKKRYVTKMFNDYFSFE